MIISCSTIIFFLFLFFFKKKVQCYTAEHIRTFKRALWIGKPITHNIPLAKNIKNSPTIKRRADQTRHYSGRHWATKSLRIAKSAARRSWKGIHRTINQSPDQIFLKNFSWVSLKTPKKSSLSSAFQKKIERFSEIQELGCSLWIK